MPSLIQVAEPVIGTIAIFSGTLASIPKDWQLCDGSNGTPDLLDKFVRGHATGTTEAGDTGGESTHVLTEVEIASHSHGVTESTHTHTQNLLKINLAGTVGILQQSGDSGQTTDSTFDPLASPLVGSQGSDTAHENKPAFFEIAYIMRVN